jgi:hypothetical protein
VHDVAVALDAHPFRDLHRPGRRDLRHVVAHQVDEHRVLRLLFRIREQVVLHRGVGVGRGPALAGAGDGPAADEAARGVDGDELLRGGRDDGEAGLLEESHIGAGVGFLQRGEERRGVGVAGRREARGQVRLEEVAVVDEAAQAAHGHHELVLRQAGLPRAPLGLREAWPHGLAAQVGGGVLASPRRVRHVPGEVGAVEAGRPLLAVEDETVKVEVKERVRDPGWPLPRGQGRLEDACEAVGEEPDPSARERRLLLVVGELRIPDYPGHVAEDVAARLGRAGLGGIDAERRLDLELVRRREGHVGVARLGMQAEAVEQDRLAARLAQAQVRVQRLDPGQVAACLHERPPLLQHRAARGRPGVIGSHGSPPTAGR